MEARPVTIIRQDARTAECRAVMHAALLHDLPCATMPTDKLGDHAAALAGGRALPVGSVEFVRDAMRYAGMQEPAWICFPESLGWFLRRDVRQLRAGSVLGTHFIKPVATKLFNGFVFDTMQDPAHLDEHDREQHDAFMAMPCDDPVWVCGARQRSCRLVHAANGCF